MHCVEHLAGMNRVHPQIHQIRTKFDEFVCNRAGRYLHSITLASLNVFRTPASTIWSGRRRSMAGDRAPALARHGRQVAVAWQRRGCPTPCPPSLSRRPYLPSTAPRPLGHGIWSPRTPHTRARACPTPPKPPQRAREASPPPSSRHATPRPLGTLASPRLPWTRIVDVAHPTIASPPSCAAPKPYPLSNTSLRTGPAPPRADASTLPC